MHFLGRGVLYFGNGHHSPPPVRCILFTQGMISLHGSNPLEDLPSTVPFFRRRGRNADPWRRRAFLQMNRPPRPTFLISNSHSATLQCSAIKIFFGARKMSLILRNDKMNGNDMCMVALRVGVRVYSGFDHCSVFLPKSLNRNFLLLSSEMENKFSFNVMCAPTQFSTSISGLSMIPSAMPTALSSPSSSSASWWG